MKITFLASGNINSNFTHRALKLASELHKIGHEVSIIVPSADKYNDFVAEKITFKDGVKVIQPFQFKTKKLVINLFPYIINGIYRVLREKPDLIYIYKPTPITIIGLVSKVFYRTPVVLDMDDLGSEVMRIEGHPVYQRKLVEWCEKVVARYANRIVVSSIYLSDMYQALFPNKPIHLMPNGVDEEWFTPVTLSQKNKQIVFMGALNRKNILEPLFDVFPNILKVHPDANVLIIGGGKFSNYFEKKSRELGIDKHITFTGWLEISKARAMLHAGDIGYNYMPDQITVRAANNMKLSQYMVRGVVPFVSDVGDLKISVDSGEAGYVCKPDDLNALQEELMIALADPHRMKRSEHARIYAMQRFNWSILAADFSEWLGVKAVSNKKRSKKKVYVVATAVPGHFGGAQIRNYNLIKQITQQPDTSVDLFCISSFRKEENHKNLESELGIKIHVVEKIKRSLSLIIKALVFKRVQPFMAGYEASGIGDLFRGVCEESLPDVVQIEQIEAYYCIRSHIKWLQRQGVQVILDAHNVEADAFRGMLKIFSLPKRLVAMFLLPHLRSIEIEAARKCNAILTCSKIDADYFKKYNHRVYVVPNGVDSKRFQPTPKTDDPTLIFIGGMQYPPNEDGLRFYLTAIHPHVKRHIPNIKLLAIGLNPEWLQCQGIIDDSIVPLGFVEHVEPYLSEARVGICPVREGSGTRLKILTYMAAGLPVVSTTKGAEGIIYTNNKEMEVADDPEVFANSICDLLDNKPKYDTMSGHGRALVVKQYDWHEIGKTLIEAYTK